MKIAWDGVCCPDLMARQTAVEERPSLLLPGLSIFLLQLITRVRLIFLKTSVLLILLRNITRLRRLETEGSTSLEVEHLANFSFSAAQEEGSEGLAFPRSGGAGAGSTWSLVPPPTTKTKRARHRSTVPLVYSCGDFSRVARSPSLWRPAGPAQTPHHWHYSQPLLNQPRAGIRI